MLVGAKGRKEASAANHRVLASSRFTSRCIAPYILHLGEISYGYKDVLYQDTKPLCNELKGLLFACFSLFHFHTHVEGTLLLCLVISFTSFLLI